MLPIRSGPFAVLLAGAAGALFSAAPLSGALAAAGPDAASGSSAGFVPPGPLAGPRPESEATGGPGGFPLAEVLARAGENRSTVLQVLNAAPRSERTGLEFLLQHMPEHDLRSLRAEELLDEVRLAYRAREEAPWSDRVPEAVFLNDVLPNRIVSEEPAPWRRRLYARARPIVQGARTPGEAAVRLNQRLFGELGVRYDTSRSRTDQNPLQVIEEGKATCTGLSVLLVAACRAVGVPARLAGTPLWADSSGNHSWVEVWDDGWRFTGAAEPSADRLDDGWFVDRAARARFDLPVHAIWATSFAPTGETFPLAWDEDGTLDYVHGVNVTERYTERGSTRPEGTVDVSFVVRDRGGRRIPVPIEVVFEGEIVFSGTTHGDERDGNDHLRAALAAGGPYEVRVAPAGVTSVVEFEARGETETVEVSLSAGFAEWGRPRSLGRGR